MLALFPESVSDEVIFFVKMIGKIAELGLGKDEREFDSNMKKAFLATDWSEEFLWNLTEIEMSDRDDFRDCFSKAINSYNSRMIFPSYGVDGVVVKHANFSKTLAKQYLETIALKGHWGRDETVEQIVSLFRSDDEIVTLAFSNINSIRYMKGDYAEKLLPKMLACLDNRQYEMVQEYIVQTIVGLTGAYTVLENKAVLSATLDRFMPFPKLHRYFAGNSNLSSASQKAMLDKHLD